MSEGALAHAHHRSQSATAQAGDLFNSELLAWVSILRGGNPQVTPQSSFDPLGAGDVAGGATADPHQMASHRFVAKHIIKGRNTGYRGGGDFRPCTNRL